MTVTPAFFDNPEVLEVGVSGPGSANRLFVAKGVAAINFNGRQDDWTRDDLVFVIPVEGERTPVESGGQALEVGTFQDSVVSVFPATVQSLDGETVGWGVDAADTITVPGGAGGDRVQVTARVVVRNSTGTLLRVGFSVHILATTQA